jgi:hypothetical protein
MTTIKQQHQQKVDALLTDCNVFWAFSNEQFDQNKVSLNEGDKYVSIGAGGYMPKSNVDKWQNGWKEIKIWYKQAGKDKKAREAHIIYELNNHEAFYTYDLEDTLNALGGDYTIEEVRNAFNKELKRISK